MRTILVVDDETNMRFLLRLVFESDGFDVVEAHDGVQALERLNDYPPPDLVVTDLMMPLMGGRELVARLRGDPETAAIPILALSSGRNTVVSEADAVLRKPVNPYALLATAHSLAPEPK